MKTSWIIFIFLVAAMHATETWSQDERTFRELLLYQAKKDQENAKKPEYDYKVTGNRYFLDLTGDDRPESFFVAKRDGQDWVEFFDNKNEKLYEFKFDTVGSWSRVYRVQKRKISETSNVLIFYFFEGITRYVNFRGSARVYFLSWDGDDLSTLNMFKGPYVWDEQRTFRNHYHQRKSEVSMYDFNNDDVREIAVRYGSITRVFKYMGKGSWQQYGD